MQYHFIIFNLQSSSSPGLPLTVCAGETASQSWQEAHALVAVSHHFLFLDSILYFLHFHYALVAVSHHQGHHVQHRIIKVNMSTKSSRWRPRRRLSPGRRATKPLRSFQESHSLALQLSPPSRDDGDGDGEGGNEKEQEKQVKRSRSF